MPTANRALYIEFQVDDIDAGYIPREEVLPIIHQRKTMLWGNKTFQFRDPKGNRFPSICPRPREANDGLPFDD